MDPAHDGERMCFSCVFSTSVYCIYVCMDVCVKLCVLICVCARLYVCLCFLRLFLYIHVIDGVCALGIHTVS